MSEIKMTPTERRVAFLVAAMAEVNTKMTTGQGSTITDAEWRELAEHLATEGPKLGRTARWVSTCGFPTREIESGSEPRWAVLQGVVWMGYAA